MKMASIREDMRELGTTNGFTEIQINTLVRAAMAGMLNMTVGDLTTRLNNKETVTPANASEGKGTDAETQGYLLKAGEVTKAIKEQEKNGRRMQAIVR